MKEFLLCILEMSFIWPMNSLYLFAGGVQRVINNDQYKLRVSVNIS